MKFQRGKAIELTIMDTNATETINTESAIIQTKSPLEKTKKRSILHSLKTEKPLRCILDLMIIKSLLPIVFFYLLYICMVLFHIFVIQNYCFFPGLCSCDGIIIYLYMCGREIVQTYALILVWSQVSNDYITDGFFGSKTIKLMFYVGHWLYLALLFFAVEKQKYKEVLPMMRIISNGALVTIGRMITLLLLVCKKNLPMRNIHLKRLGSVILFELFYFMHLFVLKQKVTFYILELLRNRFTDSAALELFKLFLLIYYSFYQFIVTKFLLNMYKNIVNDDKIQIDIVIHLAKYFYLDIQTITVLNILSISLTMPVSWISYFNYVYSLSITYSGTNPIGKLIEKMFFWIFRKKQRKHIDEANIEFKKLISGCIYESNIIIGTRIVIFRLWPYYWYFTRNSSLLFSDCSMRIKSNFNEIEVGNMILVFSTQILTVVLIAFYMLKKKVALINIQIEDYWLFSRTIEYFNLITFLDFAIQFYESLNHKKQSDFF